MKRILVLFVVLGACSGGRREPPQREAEPVPQQTAPESRPPAPVMKTALEDKPDFKEVEARRQIEDALTREAPHIEAAFQTGNCELIDLRLERLELVTHFPHISIPATLIDRTYRGSSRVRHAKFADFRRRYEALGCHLDCATKRTIQVGTAEVQERVSVPIRVCGGECRALDTEPVCYRIEQVDPRVIGIEIIVTGTGGREGEEVRIDTIPDRFNDQSDGSLRTLADARDLPLQFQLSTYIDSEAPEATTPDALEERARGRTFEFTLVARPVLAPASGGRQ